MKKGIFSIIKCQLNYSKNIKLKAKMFQRAKLPKSRNLNIRIKEYAVTKAKFVLEFAKFKCLNV
jgi:hypothetical protein